MKILLTLLCATISLIVKNTGDIQRQEVAEADLRAVCQQLGVDTDASLVVKNAFGQKVTYQKTYDGKLLLYAAVQPGSEAVFTITTRNPIPMKSYVFGKVYPERADDITWENDLGIYRVYGSAASLSTAPNSTSLRAMTGPTASPWACFRRRPFRTNCPSIRRSALPWVTATTTAIRL